MGNQQIWKLWEVWAYSLNACCYVAECLETMEGASSTDNMHNEEKNSRIPYDQVDRDILRKKMEVSIDIFDATQHGERLVNIAGLYPSTFADHRFSWRIEFNSHWSWGVHMGRCKPHLWGPGALPLEGLAISPTPGFQIAFPCIIWWHNLFLF